MMDLINTVLKCLSVVVLFILHLFGCNPTRTPAGAPIPIEPGAKTYRDAAADQSIYLQRSIVEPYLAIGPRNPAWDAQGREYLERVIDNWSKPYCCSREPMANLVTNGEALLAMGCNSPMVVYCHGRVVINNRYSTYPALYPALRQCIADTENSAYPGNRTFTIPRDLANEGFSDGDELARMAAERLIKSFGETQYIAGSEEWWVTQMTQALEEHALKPYRDPIMAAVRQAFKADPWIVHTLEGQCHVLKGWDARGDGYGDTVTDEGWKIFGEELELARDAFTSAWKERPDIPISAAKMITITAAGYGNPGETPRVWFDRSIAANIDHDDAYSRLIGALRPRWGGSHREMYDFGLACLETDRYDTLIPLNFLDSIQCISREETGNSDSWDREGVHGKLKRMIRGYKKDPKNPIRLSYLKSLEAGIEWQYDGRRISVEKLVDQLGPDLEQGPFVKYFGVTVDTTNKCMVQVSRGISRRKPIHALPLRVASSQKPITAPTARPPMRRDVHEEKIVTVTAPPLNALIGSTLDDVTRLRGRPRATRVVAGTTIWTYSDGEIESDDGHTVTRVRTFRRE